MNTKIKFLIIASVTFLLFACGPTPKEKAKEKFDQATELFNEKKYNDAKVVLDSILELFPGEIEFATRAKDLMRTIKLSEQERSLAFLDSALKQKNSELEVLMKNFTVSQEYGEKDILIHKRQKPQNSYNRTYLRAHLDMDGNFYISSRYSGDHYIYHNQIKVYNKGKSVTSQVIPDDGYNIIRFEDGGTYWEVVNYKDNKDNGIIDFISQNINEPLKVQFIGKKNYYILLEKYDKEAISDGYEISFVLKEISKIKKEIKVVKEEINRLK